MQIFYHALLYRTDFSNSNLAHAELYNADLSSALLFGADLSKALGLVPEQVNMALGDKDTKLPEGMPCPEHWKEGYDWSNREED